MGKIDDAIEEVENELNEARSRIEELESEVKVLEYKNEDLEVTVSKYQKILEQYNAMEDYLEEYHPGIITSFEVANRMET